MNCFNHTDTPAVGICKSCCKGLCADCAGVVENGLACKNACEEKVRLINRITDSSEKVIVTANSRMRFSGAFMLLAGAFICYVSIASRLAEGANIDWFFAALGVWFVVYGLWNVSRKRLYPKMK